MPDRRLPAAPVPHGPKSEPTAPDDQFLTRAPDHGETGSYLGVFRARIDVSATTTDRNADGQPPILEGCIVLPPMHQGNGSTGRHRGNPSKAKGNRSRRATADRFAVLNAFVDAGMVGLSKVEMGTWLTLYRDTKLGTACTSMESIAQRIGCTRRAVVDAVRRLRQRGLLIQVFKGSNLRGSSRYRVWPTPKPPKR